MSDKSKPCPGCGEIIDPCKDPCGMWDCNWHSHLAKECPSDQGKEYRDRINKRKSRVNLIKIPIDKLEKALQEIRDSKNGPYGVFVDALTEDEIEAVFVNAVEQAKKEQGQDEQ